jgi:hypothetical protein
MSTLKNLIKIAAMGAVVYGAYKYGKSVGDKSIQPEKRENPFPELTKYPFCWKTWWWMQYKTVQP